MNDAELIVALEAAAVKFEARALAGETFAVGKADVCRDLIRKFSRYGRWASLRQRGYAEALVRWTQPRSPVQQAVAERSQAVAETRSQERVEMGALSLERISQLFASAALHGISFPKIRLRRGEWAITIYPAPRHSRNAGSYYVKARSGTGQKLYCGMLASTGAFTASNQCPLDVLEALREFSADPTRAAAAYGHALGHCCFCGRGLTDARSVAMGYGPVCANHFGLEWGEQRARSRVTAEDIAAEAGLPPVNVTINAPRVTLGHDPRAMREDLRRAREATALETEDRLREAREALVRSLPPLPAPPAPVRIADDDEDINFM